MKTVTVISRKGGAGKTTVSLNLALAAKQAGLRAMIADIDPLQSAATIVGARPEAPSFLFETKAAKLFVLQDACRKNGCDLLIVDTPTGPEPDVVMAMNFADLCVIVTRPTTLDVAAIRESIGLVQRANCPGLIVLNQCPPHRRGEETVGVRRAIEQLLFSRLPVATTRLRSRTAYQDAFAHGLGVTEWDLACDGATDVLRLLAEISDKLSLPLRAKPAPKPMRSAPTSLPVHILQRALRAHGLPAGTRINGVSIGD